jgi:2-polyprenyl-6-methoxyphenol hydroxylase-like FAD-dependent oxidoreductase
LLDEVRATGCPPITDYSFDFGAFTIAGTSHPVDGISNAYAPRRTVLDKVLVDAARASGAEVREGCNVEGLVVEDGRVVGIRTAHGEERARIVIGADGRNSRVAQVVGATEYNTKPRLQYAYYTYFSDLPTTTFESYIRPDRGFACAATNDGLTMVVVGWPYAEAAAYKSDVEGNFLRTLDLAPDFAARVSAATRQAPFLGGSVPSWFRQPYGEGWALVGDSGYNKDPITAQGISDAFLDAERCTRAIDRWLGQEVPYDDAMRAWHAERDAATMPIYEFTAQLATLELPPQEMQQLLGAIHGNPAAMNGFVSVVSGALSPAEFFSEESIGRILSAVPVH